MTVPVLTAVTGAPWEAALVAELERTTTNLTVVRRCVDLADLLAVAATGTAGAALLSAGLRWLDRDALSRLSAAGVAVVGLFTPGDDAAELLLRQLGVGQVLPADAGPVDIAAAVARAMRDQARAAPTRGWADPREMLRDGSALPDDLELRARFELPNITEPPNFTERLDGSEGLDGSERLDVSTTASVPGVQDDRERSGSLGVPTAAADEPSVMPEGGGQLVAVWGPSGAPGRTTITIAVASELARAGVPTLLADADVYGGVVAQMMGFLDEAPGLAAAARLANLGQLDVASLARLAPVASPRLRVLTGISRADRWSELRPAALAEVWSLARSLCAVTVVDCSFSLEQDEELSFDTAAPRRNAATLLTLDDADTVLAVGSADPVGVQRLLRGLAELREAVPGVMPKVILNRVRRSAVGAKPELQLAHALERYAGVRDVAFVPYERATFDAAVLAARCVDDIAPDSPARLALAGIAAGLLGRPAPNHRRRRLGRRPLGRRRLGRGA